MSTEKKPKTTYWFKRRRYGWGWVPTTWQGWVVVATALVVITGGAFAIASVPPEQQNRDVAFYVLFVYIVATALVVISYKKGPKPRWRWGKTDKDNPDEDF